jgi:hypothetical protein
MSTASSLATDNNYEIDYESNASSLNNIATAMVVNPNLNYHYVTNNNSSSIENNTNNSNTMLTSENEHSDSDTVGNFNYNVSNVATSFTNNLSLNSNENSNANKGFSFFGANLLGSNNIGYSASLMSSAQYTAGIENKCLRCGSQVYALERIGPIKGNIYHKTCFKCLTCERQLDLKTYYTNQIDLNDRQIYCQSHAPKSGKGLY